MACNKIGGSNQMQRPMKEKTKYAWESSQLQCKRTQTHGGTRVHNREHHTVGCYHRLYIVRLFLALHSHPSSVWLLSVACAWICFNKIVYFSVDHPCLLVLNASPLFDGQTLLSRFFVCRCLCMVCLFSLSFFSHSQHDYFCNFIYSRISYCAWHLLCLIVIIACHWSHQTKIK